MEAADFPIRFRCRPLTFSRPRICGGVLVVDARFGRAHAGVKPRINTPARANATPIIDQAKKGAAWRREPREGRKISLCVFSATISRRKRLASRRRSITEQFDMRHRRLGNKAHNIYNHIVEIIQRFLRQAGVDLTRLHGEPEPLSIESDASFGVSHRNGGMVDARFGPGIVPRELDQLKRMSVGIAKLEGHDAAGKRLRAIS
jgi:hypothetical protein